MPSFADARALTEQMLAEHLPDRWRHVQAVAQQAARLAVLPDVERDVLLPAAVLHDIGYSPVLARVRFHPLDGARFLSARGWDARVVALVAHHSAAAIEAELRGGGLAEGLAAFPDERSATRDALWYCDAVTGPQGQRVDPDARWAEIRVRYGAEHVVTHALDRADPHLRAAADATAARIAAAGL